MLISAQALNVIITIARCGSFAAAAEELHKVPTALSYTVHKLESELGLKLFKRLGKQLELTEAGRYFISKGQIILTQLDDLQFATQRIAAGVETRLNITLNNIVSLRPVYTLLSESELLFPQTEIHIAIDVHDGVWDALLEKRADIAIAAPNQVALPGEICCLEIGTAEWLFAIAPDHPLTAIHRPLRADDLRRYPAVCIPDTSVKLDPKSPGSCGGKKRWSCLTIMQKSLCISKGWALVFCRATFVSPILMMADSSICMLKRANNRRRCFWPGKADRRAPVLTGGCSS
jgi:DNA-binding transcriptional LysR family regulator